MKARRVTSLGTPVPPTDAPVWETVPSSDVQLSPVPIDAVDASSYVRQGLDQESVGAVETVTVRIAYDEDRIAVRLDWPDPSRDDAVRATEEFADKAAVAFPLAPGGSVMSMGSDSAPINAWYWRADRDRPYDVIARGFGDVERRDATLSGLAARATYGDDTWSLVLARDREFEGDGFVDLDTAPPGIAVAIWEGHNHERGPLKSYSGEFRTLKMS